MSDQQSGNTGLVVAGVVLAVVAYFVPILGIVALIVGAVALGRGELAGGIVVMCLAVLLAGAGFVTNLEDAADDAAEDVEEVLEEPCVDEESGDPLDCDESTAIPESEYEYVPEVDFKAEYRQCVRHGVEFEYRPPPPPFKEDAEDRREKARITAKAERYCKRQHPNAFPEVYSPAE